MPLTLPELEKMLGLKYNELRSRLNAIRDILDSMQAIRRGPHNQIILTDNGVALLQRLHELIKEGRTIRQASEELRRELDLTKEREPALRKEVRLVQIRLNELEKRLNELERQVDLLRVPRWRRMLPSLFRRQEPD